MHTLSGGVTEIKITYIYMFKIRHLVGKMSGLLCIDLGPCLKRSKKYKFSFFFLDMGLIVVNMIAMITCSRKILANIF